MKMHVVGSSLEHHRYYILFIRLKKTLKQHIVAGRVMVSQRSPYPSSQNL